MDNSEENILIEMDPAPLTERTYKCDCGKSYAERSGLRKHKLKCPLPNATKLEDLEDEVKSLLNKTAQFEARIKKLAEKNEELTKQLEDERRQHTVEIQLKNHLIDTKNQILDNLMNVVNATRSHVVGTTGNSIAPIPIPLIPPKKKLINEEYLKENCSDAIDALEFMGTIEYEEDDFEGDAIRNTVPWFVNIIDRNLKNTIVDVNRRPFHFIRDSNTKKTIMFVKTKDGWSCDPSKIESILRKARLRCKNKLLMMTNEAREIQTQADKQYYYPEKDEDGELIVKDWSTHRPKSDYIEYLEIGINMMIKDLGDNDREVIRLMKDLYTLKEA